MAAPNVSDKVNLKYCIPKLIFTKQVDRIQYFNIYVKVFDSDPEAYNLRPWNLYASNVGVNINGTFVGSVSLTGIVENGKLYINGLSDYKEYCIKFVHTQNSNIQSIFKFKTGYAMTLKDSPYYHRVLFPEQNYDIHVADTDEYELPKPRSVFWYYPFDAHKLEKRYADEELYASFIPADLINDLTSYYLIQENSAFDSLEITDPVTGETLMMYASETKNNNAVLLCPSIHYVAPNWVPHKYYDVADGGGCIALADMAYRQPEIVVYIDSNSQEALRCLYHWDNRLLTRLGTRWDTRDYYCYVYVDSSGHIVCKYLDTTTETEVTVTSQTVLPLNRLFILDIFNHRFKEWDNSTSGQTETVNIPINAFSHNFKVALAYKDPLGNYTIVSDWMSVDNSLSSGIVNINPTLVDPTNFKLSVAYKADEVGATTYYDDVFTGVFTGTQLTIVRSFESNDAYNEHELAGAIRGTVTLNSNNEIEGSFVISPQLGYETITRPIDDSHVTAWQNIDIPIAYSYNSRHSEEYDPEMGDGGFYEGKIPGTFAFGGPNAEKIYFAKATAIEDDDLDTQIEEKMLKPSRFKAIIELVFHFGDNTYDVQRITNCTAKPESIGFFVPLYADYYNKEIVSIDMRIVAGEEIQYSERLEGLTVGNHYIAPYTFPEDYVEDSFDIDFKQLATTQEKTTALKENFFTKHGSWGGYNGGVNGHNCYFNHNGVLVLENHGDRYLGQLRAVGKESIPQLEHFTGYGEDLYVSYPWDTRLNKQCLRVGTTLVSNKYFTFGKLDIWMKLPKGIYGVCPAIWFFHYIEVPEGDPRYNSYPYNERVIQGSADAGYYRVVNNEIDIELPSHLTKGSAESFADLDHCFFDPIGIDKKTMIGIGNASQNDDLFNTGLFQLTDVTNPYSRGSWEQVDGYAGWYPVSWQPSFQNCKFNNWQGEYNSGDGWVHEQYYEDPISGVIQTVSARDYYYGTEDEGANPMVNEKEEYLAIFNHLTDDPDGMADNHFHKWTIEWLPDRTVLYVDDTVVRVNKGFIPFNVMKLTIGTWFPTMPLAKEVDDGLGNITIKKCGTKEYLDADGVYDQNGIYGVKRGMVSPIGSDKTIGTWAGRWADWEVCQVEISRVKYQKYERDDVINTYDNDSNGNIVPDSVTVNADPTYFGESYPESGLRWFDVQ